MSKIKILLVNIAFLPESVGGSEFYTYHLAKALQQNGYDVTVLSALEDVSLPRYRIINCSFEDIKVIKIVNSPIYARSYIDFFINNHIDTLFREIVESEKPALIHFQHVAYLSGNLPEIAYQLNIPTIFTLHDYWYICFRSHLLRPGCGICLGPSAGLNCATCDDPTVPNPTAIPRHSALLRWINLPSVRKWIDNLLKIIPEPVVAFLRARLFRGIKPKANPHQNPTILPILENKFRFDFFKCQLEFPTYVLSPSYHLKKRYENQGYRDITVLPLGFPETELVSHPPFEGVLNIVYIGNIERHKGLLVLLRELLTLPNPKRIELHVYGRAKDPIYSTEVKKVAASQSQCEIYFHGEYHSDRDLGQIFTKSHIAVFPSLWEENYPLVIREALLRGMPVIASNLGGVPEVIEDGVNGLLFDPYQQGDLGTKIQLILETPALLETITVGARNTNIETMAAHVSKLSDLYKTALADGHRPKGQG